jgi:hypothetical protein
MSTPDLTRDPELATALRGALGDVPEPDWARLHASVAARAELPLARLRRETRPAARSWRRVRPLVPLAAAAGIAAAALAISLRPASPPPLTEADLRMVDQIVESQLPDVDPLLTGELAREEMINAVAGS